MNKMVEWGESYRKVKPIFELYGTRITVRSVDWNEGQLVYEDRKVAYAARSFEVMLACMLQDLLKGER